MIALKHIGVEQGAFRLEDVSFEVPEGRYAVLMGGTGSGKTTLLEVICGLRSPQKGQVLLRGADVTACAPSARGVGYVPQDGALFKTMTVFENLAFALAIRRRPPAEIRTRVQELSGLLGIEHLLDRGTEGLSGGERQRVALGRALSFRPQVLVLDEPLTALDVDTRGQIVILLKNVQAHTGVTTLHVTHNPEEARTLCDMLLLLENGQVRRDDQNPRQD